MNDVNRGPQIVLSREIAQRELQCVERGGSNARNLSTSFWPKTARGKKRWLWKTLSSR
jgi:hypothetical protein